MESDELVKLVKVLKESKISHYKADGVELNFHYTAYETPIEPIQDDEDDEEELLFLSSGVKGIKRGK